METYRETWAEVSLDAIQHNVQAARKLIGHHVKMMAVVKANAYGHGVLPVAIAALNAGAEWLGVAMLEEAVQLREAGITAPVLVLGYVSPKVVGVAAERNVTLTAVSVDHARDLACAAHRAQLSRPLQIHLKIDTGMGRLGVASPAEVADAMRFLTDPSVEVTGAFTHFAQADSANKTHVHKQIDAVTACFDMLIQLTPNRETLTLHAANSAGIIDLPESYFDMVRLGISLYGVYPSDEVVQERMPLVQALKLYTRIAHVKRVPAGTTIGYGSTFVTDCETTVATLPLGYADGVFRSLSNRGFLKIGRERCPILGRVCMDQLMIDVSKVPHAKVGDVVTLYDAETLPVLSELAGTIPYELLCAISSRVPRIYQ